MRRAPPTQPARMARPARSPRLGTRGAHSASRNAAHTRSWSCPDAAASQLRIQRAAQACACQWCCAMPQGRVGTPTGAQPHVESHVSSKRMIHPSVFCKRVQVRARCCVDWMSSVSSNTGWAPEKAATTSCAYLPVERCRRLSYSFRTLDGQIVACWRGKYGGSVACDEGRNQHSHNKPRWHLGMPATGRAYNCTACVSPVPLQEAADSIGRHLHQPAQRPLPHSWRCWQNHI
jgi:hypothetical protein